MGWRRRVVGAGVGYAVAGPGGALVGAALGGGDDAGWHDLSDVPFGVNAEVAAEDDAVGRRWTLTFLSEVPSPAVALVQLRDDAGRLVAGRAPFRDARGRFAAEGAIVDGRAVIYAPFGAAAPDAGARVSLEVAVFRVGSGVEPVGRATLDGELPGSEIDVAGYLAPVVALVAKAAGGALDDGARTRLREALGVPRDVGLSNVEGLSVAEAREALRFRFPAMDRAAWRELLRTVLGEDADEAAIDGALDGALDATIGAAR